ncbi:hypothetical protein [Streptomyces sp. Tu 3180]|uniref:hypothetical protein n=1 Tax=Streptomyces sp. Tu 3180 TaxID=2682611 RepID=UPI001FB7EE27|nr:hypothetical protein [Streptomyces sp. Tu 3180]
MVGVIVFTAVGVLEEQAVLGDGMAEAGGEAPPEAGAAVVCADSALREALAGLTNPHLIKRCAALEALDATGPATAARPCVCRPAESST